MEPVGVTDSRNRTTKKRAVSMDPKLTQPRDRDGVTESVDLRPLASSARKPIPKLRWWIGGLLFASTVINYLDRQTFSILGPYLKADYGWTNEDFALVV